MKKLLIPLIFIAMSISCQSNQTNSKDDVAAAVELFRKTMVKPDQAVFEGLTSEILSYGHSNGLVEDRETCIASMVTGKFKFLSIDISDQTINITGNTAVVRHIFFAHTHDKDKEPGTVKLKVLQIWQNDKGGWKLIARQAVKV